MTAPKCFYCDRPTSRAIFRNHDCSRTIDHIIPKSKGGLNNRGNTVIACARCNSARNDDPAFFFLEFVMTALDDVNASPKRTRRLFVEWMVEKGVKADDGQDVRTVRQVVADMEARR